MNILFVETSIRPTLGGIERVSWMLSHYLEQQGHACFYAYCFHDYEEVDASRKMAFDLNGDEASLQDAFLRFMDAHQISVVVNQDIYLPALIRLYARLRAEGRCRVIHCFHMSPDYLYYFKPGKRDALRYLFRHPFQSPVVSYRQKVIRDKQQMYGACDRFVLLSPTFIADFLKIYRLVDREQKIRCISNPLSFACQPDIAAYRKKKQVLIIARLEDTQKNISSALRIWKCIEEAGLDDWNLVIGGSGPDEKRLHGYARQLGLQRVAFLGNVTAPQQLYGESALFMMTSRFEGFGVTLTEALQCGCIPFAFDNFSVLHDILDDGYNGFIIESGNESLYALAMMKLMGDGQERAKISAQALKSSQRFDMDVIGKKWLELLAELRS